MGRLQRISKRVDKLYAIKIYEESERMMMVVQKESLLPTFLDSCLSLIKVSWREMKVTTTLKLQ